MKRAVIAGAWIVGATVPSLLAAAFLFGCCVLPFHHVLHKAMPMCHAAVAALAGHSDDAPASPAKEKQEPVKRIAVEMPRTERVIVTRTAGANVPAATASHRDFITHGALRCDRDVGLHDLDATYRI